LGTLVSQGLLEQTNSSGTFKYKISNVGREFLQAYNTFNKFADSFGLTI
jgi:predicted transcriptional regulator